MFDPARGRTLAASPARGTGWWAGAPAVARWRGDTLLAYRLRGPRPRRGYALRLARVAAERLEPIAEVRARDIAALSIERAALVADADVLRVYLSYAAEEDGRWRIDLTELRDPAALPEAAREPALGAASTGTESVKDPVVVPADGGWEMYASFTPRHDAADLSTGDVFATGAAPSCTGLATSADGRRWEWRGGVLVPEPGGWDAYETRISCLLDERHALYDGIATVAENYEERTGLAVRDRARWRRVTTDAPLLDARYAAFDGERFYFERPAPDGSHELAVADADVPLR